MVSGAKATQWSGADSETLVPFACQKLTSADSGVFRAMPRIDAEMPEELLVVALINNVPRAWVEFQRRYERLIYRCITKVTRRFSSVVCEEDLREIYATLVLSLLQNDRRKLRSFDPERGNRFSTWLGLLAVNCAYDHLRSIRREPHKGTLAEAEEIVSRQPDPFELVAELEHARIAKDTLGAFSSKDRTFAALYFGEGMEPAEIARTMKISVKTVYSKKHKIQSRLGALLDQPAATLAA